VGDETEAEDDQVVVGRRGVQEKPRGNASRQNHHPHHAAGHLGVPLSADRLGAERVHDGQEAVDADAGEEEDAAVHVGVEERHGDLAEHAPEQPVAPDKVHDPERQAEDEEGVRDDQVDHVGQPGEEPRPGPKSSHCHSGFEY
uniref:Uncharacterized protein n=1 Tax=Salarias fasciatus TaxID=181472 RepID=A0A672JSJ5_SALFA